MKVSLPIIVVASIFARSTAAQIDDPSRAGPTYWGTVIIQDEVNFKNVPYCEVPGQNRFRCPCFEPAVGKEYDCKMPVPYSLAPADRDVVIINVNSFISVDLSGFEPMCVTQDKRRNAPDGRVMEAGQVVVNKDVPNGPMVFEDWKLLHPCHCLCDTHVDSHRFNNIQEDKDQEHKK
ncbi:hypothetical protein TUN199_00750 [Pyrenophora tritici-repentis]|nr:hypothetical protein Alg130_07765 [Pyrenophora tritici-repentis]KAI0608360.1 hypothetical protein TUN205_07393 [Pyrenophora tritici-repentis]KAI0627191.1 hypothetical protein TUN199_00750 [Pyrenophora tritici-repentis]KAI1530394.1 hypothetical protein PtrSN001A_008171 [Pyrenophora tritici-repentis]KAI1565158.1 hypothetical protein PtrEW4_008380 [Pyrenophora tritici-repentis]